MTIELQTPDADRLAHGELTIRDYFAARAPAEVPDWFEPVEWIPPTYPPAPEGMSAAMCARVREFDEPDGLDEIETAYWKAWWEAEHERGRRRLAAKLRRQTRWAFAWADAMLRERAKGGAA